MSEDHRITAEGILRATRLRGALASVSLSHPAACACLVCKAGRGDGQALRQIAIDMDDIL